MRVEIGLCRCVLGFAMVGGCSGQSGAGFVF